MRIKAVHIIIISVLGLMLIGGFYAFNYLNVADGWNQENTVTDSKMSDEIKKDNVKVIDTQSIEKVNNDLNQTDDKDSETDNETDDSQTDGDSTDEDDSQTREPPLSPTPLRVRIVSSIPLADSVINSVGDMRYPVLGNAEITTHQDIINLGVEDFIRTSTTGDKGFSGEMMVENEMFSSWNDVDQKMEVIIESDELVADNGAVAYVGQAPDKETEVNYNYIRLLPDTYGFETQLTVTGDNNRDVEMVNDLKPCSSSSSGGWNLAHWLNPMSTDNIWNNVSVELSTDGENWQEQKYVYESAIDDSGDDMIPIVIRPQVLDSYDMHETGDKTLYVKLDITWDTDSVYKVTYDVTHTDIRNIEITDVSGGL